MGNSISTYSNITNPSLHQTGGFSEGITDDKASNLDSTSLEKTLGYIVAYYILTLDLSSLRNLHEKEYCDQLVRLTSEIIHKQFNDLEVNQFLKRIMNDPDSNSNSNFDIESESKEDKCNQIAKFYIKIAHVFSTIITTVNPEYVYNDTAGNIKKIPLAEKNNIPIDAKISVSKLNLCGERIDILNNAKKCISPAVNPDICSIKINDDKSEPKIPDFFNLYMDEYDIKTGEFMEMSESTRAQYQTDLERFYTVFTGNEKMPIDIKKFGDIKLKDYSKSSQSPNISTKKCSTQYKDDLFTKYALNLKNMIDSVNKNQEKLLDIINKLFEYVEDPITKQEVVRIHSKLTDMSLQDIVSDTRNIIIELYLRCEGDFAEGVDLYEAIVECKIFETSKNQLKSLEKAAEKLITP